jgi:hypothetical protein
MAKVKKSMKKKSKPKRVVREKPFNTPIIRNGKKKPKTRNI